MQSPTVKDDIEESRSVLTTPFTCPYSVTVRRNPSRKARPTNLPTAVPFPADDVPIVDVLEKEPPPRKEISGTDSFSGQSQISEDLKVFLRIRPLKGKLGAEKSMSKDGELRLKKNAWPRPKKDVDVAKDKKSKKSDVSCIVVNDSTSVSVLPPLAQQDSRRIKTETYDGFSQVFEPESSQEQVYDRMMKPLVEDFMKGKSGMLVAMGPSGSGKTHTVFGCPRDPGMVPLALKQIFQLNGDGYSTPSRSFRITIFEITSEWGKGEKILDLLSDGADISIYQSKINGLQEIVIADLAQAESIIACAMLKRSTAMTKANSQSSRSQCVINIHLAPEKAERPRCTLSSAVLTIIDLAGAERSKHTGLQGKRLGESSFINNTSMIFGLCLRSLLEHQKNPKKQLQRHFQSSLLTRYLRDYLEGKKRMSLILTIKSEEEDYNDTSFVLRQASPFMQIKFACTPQPDLLGAKRNLQATTRYDQAKRVKFSHLTGHKADREGCETETDHHLDEEVIFIDKIRESPAQTTQAQSVDVKKKEKNEDSSYNFNKLQRSSHIMLNITKATWNVVKEYKNKLQDAVKEIDNLKEILDFEKTRRLEMEEEIQYLKSNCSCSKKNSAESDLVKVDAYLEFSADRSQNNLVNTSTAEEANPKNSLRCEASQFADSAREFDISQGNDLKACLQNDCDARFNILNAIDDLKVDDSLERSGTKGHYSICVVDSTRDDQQVITSPLSPIATEPEENGNCQQSDTLVPQRLTSADCQGSTDIENDKTLGHTSAVKEGCCNLLGTSHDEHDQKNESSPGLVESNENDQLPHASVPTSVVCDEPCSLLEKSQKKHDQKIDSIPDCMRNGKSIEKSSEFSKLAINPHSSINVKGDSPQSKSSKSLLHIDENKLMKQEDRMSDSKPKRRLMPASTALLRDMRLLDYGDEFDQRSKGNRGRKKTDTKENQRTQGSINLLRLLKSNLPR